MIGMICMICQSRGAFFLISRVGRVRRLSNSLTGRVWSGRVILTRCDPTLPDPTRLTREVWPDPSREQCVFLLLRFLTLLFVLLCIVCIV